MNERRAQIESRIGELETLVRSVDDRLCRIERRLELTAEPIPVSESAAVVSPAAISAPVPAAAAPATARELDFVGSLALTGRLLLGLAGGYLLRATTSEGLLPEALGVAAGLVYAVSWIYLADRAAARGKTAAAAFYGTTSALVALPLIWETTARFGILSPVAAAGALTVITALELGVAWRRNLRALAWIAALGASISALALGGPTGAPLPFAVVAVAVGVATLWLSEGRQWRFLPWATAAVADLAVWLLWVEGPVDKGLAPAAGVLGLQLGFLVLYAGTFVRRASQRRLSQDRPVIVFAAVQTAAVVAVGFVGALAVARTMAPLVAVLGVAGLILAAAAQVAAAAAFRRGDRDPVLYFGGLATLLLFAASGALLSRPAVLWAVLAIVITGLAGRWQQSAFRLQAAVIAAVAVFGSGLAGLAVRAWTSAPAALPALAAGPLLALVAAVAVCLLVPDAEAGPWVRRFDTALLALAVAAGGGVAVALTVPLLAGSPADPAIIATVRTAVLAAAALGLATLAKRRPQTASLVYPLLLVGAVKLLIEDFPGGNPSTLFLSLALYGGALILAPRRLRAAKSDETEESDKSDMSDASDMSDGLSD